MTVSIDGVECEVLFAGLAPDFVGVYQLNIRAAAALRSGPRQLVVSVGGLRSKAARINVE